ncbi:MAG: serine/threonine protein kinase [Clostridia bacterium]|nr:serine/threonine protein kinase [Clostridia bacterium]
MIINGYVFDEWVTQNSGFSKWSFAKKNGKDYFIKQLLEPIYPMDRSVMSESMIQAKEKQCLDFEMHFANYYNAINNASHGNLVRIEEFFRCDSHYYVAMEKVPSTRLTIEQISRMDTLHKYVLLRSVAYAFKCMHDAKIVHFDVKPTNIMIQETESGHFSVKVIDFDGGFFVGEPPKGDDIGGDPAYLAPETFLALIGEEVTLDEKSDIFSLGLVMHQLFTGNMPYFDKSEYDYIYEMALDKGFIEPAYGVPEDFSAVLKKMLDADPEKRPSADDLLRFFTQKVYGKEIEVKPTELPKTPIIPTTPTPTAPASGWFSTGGDL